MRICRIQSPDGTVHLGQEHADGSRIRLEGTFPGPLEPTDEPLPEGTPLAPVHPCQIICIGLNYRAHAEETHSPLPEHPVVFMKTLNALCGSGTPVRLPRWTPSKRVDYEIELAVVIGKSGKNIPVATALEHVAGYTIANDVSARDWQKWGGGGQWVRGKSFDTFCPVGPVLLTPDEIPNPQNLQLTTRVNGEVLQSSNTSDMIFPVAEIISFLSGSSTLLPGTLILTGTPEGVGMGRDPMRFLQPGDEIEMTIDPIGTLINPVTEETP